MSADIKPCIWHYDDVIMGTMASQITSLTMVYLTVYSGENQWKHQSSASLAFVRGIHRWLVNSPHKWASNAENISIWWRHHEYCPIFKNAISRGNWSHCTNIHKYSQSTQEAILLASACCTCVVSYECRNAFSVKCNEVSYSNPVVIIKKWYAVCVYSFMETKRK